jgi:hypothetical protein
MALKESWKVRMLYEITVVVVVEDIDMSMKRIKYAQYVGTTAYASERVSSRAFLHRIMQTVDSSRLVLCNVYFTPAATLDAEMDKVTFIPVEAIPGDAVLAARLIESTTLL